jgi:anti-anti-sigma factor
MTLAPGEHFYLGTTQVKLSARLVAELGDPRSTLRATAQCNGPVVVVYAGGEIDASNEHIWHQLVSEAAAVASEPGPFVVDVNGLDFMGCCAFEVLAAEAERCRGRGIELRLVSSDPGVGRLIKVCELSEVLRLHPTTDAALPATLT